jgi:hypothetical protein
VMPIFKPTVFTKFTHYSLLINTRYRYIKPGRKIRCL